MLSLFTLHCFIFACLSCSLVSIFLSFFLLRLFCRLDYRKYRSFLSFFLSFLSSLNCPLFAFLRPQKKERKNSAKKSNGQTGDKKPFDQGRPSRDNIKNRQQNREKRKWDAVCTFKHSNWKCFWKRQLFLFVGKQRNLIDGQIFFCGNFLFFEKGVCMQFNYMLGLQMMGSLKLHSFDELTYLTDLFCT